METTGRHIVEIRRPAGGWTDLDDLLERTRRAVHEARLSGNDIRLLRSVFLPEEQSCLLVFEASASDIVRTVSERAGLAPFGVPVTAVVRLDAGDGNGDATDMEGCAHG